MQLKSEITIIIILIMVALTSTTTHAQSTYTTTHFIIYDEANAGQAYDEELGNYLEKAYSLYTNLGMKMAPPCSGSQYTIYVIPSTQQAGEAGITYWAYTYDPNTNQIVSSCVEYINISAGLSSQLLELTAYHELVHVSQAAYWQWVQPLEAYPWYIEADAEGTAEYYTNFCPLGSQYFSNQQYGYDPYDYSGKPIINMYYYASFIYWLIANGIGPATIESNVFTTSTVDVPWLDNYYVQYLLSLVHGQDICGQAYYPSFQQVSMSGNQYSLSVPLQGLSAQYYEVQLPASGTIEVSVSGGTVDSNVLLNQAFSVSNTTLYIAIVNPNTNSETVTLTISYMPGLTAKIVNATYNIITQGLSIEIYLTYAGSPVSGTVYINGTSVNANNGYITTTLSGVPMGNIVINITYSGQAVLLALSLQSLSAELLVNELYLTSNSFGYIPLSIDNPNNIYVITNVQVASPPSPTNAFKPMVYFENPNITVTLVPGSNTVDLYFFTNSTVAQGQGTVYVKISPGESLSLGYTVIPTSVSVSSATYSYTSNTTEVNVYISGIGEQSFTVPGLSGVLYVNYSTYTITELQMSIPSPNITITPNSLLITPNQASVNATITLNAQCPGYPVYYRVPFTINEQQITTENLQCGSQFSINYTFTGPYYNNEFIIGVAKQSLTIPITQPSTTIKPIPQLVAPSWAIINATMTLSAQQCPEYPVYYEYPLTVDNQQISTVKFQCGQEITTWYTLNETYTNDELTINIEGQSLEVPIIPPSVIINNTTWLMTDNASYANVTLYISGPYTYLILGNKVSNSSITTSITTQARTTYALLNIGFENLTLNVPSLSLSISLSNVTLYPGSINGSVIITTPGNAEFRGTLLVFINGTLYNKTEVYAPMGSSVNLALTIKPTLGPGVYNVTISALGVNRSGIAYDVYIEGVYISTKPLTIIGESDNISITMEDTPAIPLPINVTLMGCENKTMVVMGNTTMSLEFNSECSLIINAQIASIGSTVTAYWDDLNLALTNIAGEYQGVPLIINGSVTAMAYFDNNTQVPATVLINDTANFTVQNTGPVVLKLSVEYLGVSNTTHVRVYVVPNEYEYAKEVLSELGNPQSLNETVSSAIITGNWSLVILFLNYYNQTSHRPIDPLAMLAKYLLTKYSVNGNSQELTAAMFIVRFEIPIYVVLTLLIIMIITLSLLRRRRSGKP